MTISPHRPPTARMRSRASMLLTALLAVLMVGQAIIAAPAEAAGRTLYVDGENGRDIDEEGWREDRNSFDDPWQTIHYAMRWADPGDTIVVRGGTYVEVVGWGASAGTATKPITLTNYNNERVVLKGHLKLEGGDYWTIDGINVTYDPGIGRTESLVKFDGGVGWRLLNSEIWGTRGVSNLMVIGSSTHGVPRNYRIANNCIHSNLATGDPWMNDHNIYLQPGYDSGPGMIDRNILFGANNGSNIKAAGGDPSKTGAASVDIHFNTMADAGASIIIGYDSHTIDVHGNLFGPQGGGDEYYNAAVVGNKVSGTGNSAEDNAVSGYDHVVRATDQSTEDIATARNRFVNPDFNSVSSCSGFKPADATAAAYGAHGHGDFPPITDSGPSDTDTFVDDNDSPFESAIEKVAAAGITKGCNPPTNDRFCPDSAVTRGSMAAFLRRALELPASPKDYFRDDGSSVFENDINALAHAGVTKGCNPPTNDRYCADDLVTRGQMAAFLGRAYSYPAGSDRFTDTADSVFRKDINSLAAAGVTLGCNPPDNTRYCPDAKVTRGQMATFLVRSIGL